MYIGDSTSKVFFLEPTTKCYFCKRNTLFHQHQFNSQRLTNNISLYWSNFNNRLHVCLKPCYVINLYTSKPVKNPNIDSLLPSASCHAWLNSTGLITNSNLHNALANCFGVTHVSRYLVHPFRNEAQLVCIKWGGMLPSRAMKPSRSVARVSCLLPWILPLHLNSLAVVKL